MNKDLFPLAFLFLAGLSLGGAYFGGLWMTLQHLPQWRRPFLTLGFSLMVRLGMLLISGIWLVQSVQTPPVQTIGLISLGFWLGRTLLTARLVTLAPLPTSIRPLSNLGSDRG